MKLSEILQESLIKYPLKGTAKVEVIEELLEELVKNQLIQQRDEVLDAILERERLMTTGVGHGVAIPHCRTQLIQNFVIAIGVHPEGVDFESFDHKPAHIVFCSSPERPARHAFAITSPHFPDYFPTARSRCLAATQNTCGNLSIPDRSGIHAD
ncbi:MAG: PTS sugar transporter subunit IIA [Calditrichia bacterium]